ncbi:allantoinase AllB [Neotamlana laminarinivorans]|uniref:allantoinase n=1 Tax=Neotamlana laminarinivorans TaxID=2883124 RepID=A0A9X1I1C3_9FLAO|nr:allantoinase AllB [Tamlana laminarinivorans]MCB4798189.1 allantoinase AllB [Tamlana laminarinivorans]
MTEFLIYSKQTFIENAFVEATLHIKDGKIQNVNNGYQKLSNLPFFDYGNLVVIPGIIDAHVHINEPGREDWEGFYTATKAAAMGGVTTLIEMPLNASPVTTTVEAFKLKQNAATNKLHVNCGFYGGTIPSNTNDIEGLIKEGVFGIKGFLTHSGIDEFPNITQKDLEAIAPILKKYDVPLLLHCELSDEDVPEVENPKSYIEYLHSRPQHWETNAIELAIAIQKKFDIKVHIVHLSASKGIELINKAKKETDKLTVETCPQYLFFNAEAIPDASPIFKCAPPIREKANNDKLWSFLQSDGFNFLASDHSPAPPARKQLESGDFFKAWGGISGLQFTLPVLYTECKKRGVKLEKLIPLLTENPAKFLGLENQKGLLKKGFDADITVLDKNEKFKLTETIIEHKHKATPYLNENLNGLVKHVFVNGIQVVNNSKMHKEQQGKLLFNTLNNPF